MGVLQQEFIAEFRQLETLPPIVLELTAVEAWILLSQIQLACRHPENTGPSRKMVEGLARRIQDVLAQTPALYAIAQRGWDPDYDISEQRD
jgi:hypothetical protein